jgi:hypothetical protein
LLILLINWIMLFWTLKLLNITTNPKLNDSGQFQRGTFLQKFDLVWVVYQNNKR